jgi:hypothetical protein
MQTASERSQSPLAQAMFWHLGSASRACSLTTDAIQGSRIGPARLVLPPWAPSGPRPACRLPGPGRQAPSTSVGIPRGFHPVSASNEPERRLGRLSVMIDVEAALAPAAPELGANPTFHGISVYSVGLAPGILSASDNVPRTRLVLRPASSIYFILRRNRTSRPSLRTLSATLVFGMLIRHPSRQLTRIRNRRKIQGKQNEQVTPGEYRRS